MIKVENTENLTGVTISGSYEDIRTLHESISNVVGPEYKFDMARIFVLGLCYDLRHCYYGDREVATIDNNYSDELQRYHEFIHPKTDIVYKVNVLWIQLIFNVLALDDYVSKYSIDKHYNKMFRESNEPLEYKEHYSKTRYKDVMEVKLFQEKVWETLREAIGDTAHKKLYKIRLKYISNLNSKYKYDNFFTHYVEALETRYIYSNVKKRKNLLSKYIKKLIVLDEDYYDLEESIKDYMTENNTTADKVILKSVSYPETVIW